MPDPLPPSIHWPILIGRDVQVAALTRLMEQASASHSQIMLISGEAENWLMLNAVSPRLH